MRPEKLFGRLRLIPRPDSRPISPPQQRSPFEPEVAPVTGTEKTRLESQAQKLLEKDLSAAVFNRYVDTMILLMGTHQFGKLGDQKSRSIYFGEGDGNSRSIEFERDEKGVRSIVSVFHDRNGVGENFAIRAETLVLGMFASEAVDLNDSFADLAVTYNAAWKNLKAEELQSFIAGHNIEVPVAYEGEAQLSLKETHEFLKRTFEHYSATKLSGKEKAQV